MEFEMSAGGKARAAEEVEAEVNSGKRALRLPGHSLFLCNSRLHVDIPFQVQEASATLPDVFSPQPPTGQPLTTLLFLRICIGLMDLDRVVSAHPSVTRKDSLQDCKTWQTASTRHDDRAQASAAS